MTVWFDCLLALRAGEGDDTAPALLVLPEVGLVDDVTAAAVKGIKYMGKPIEMRKSCTDEICKSHAVRQD